ncbi:epoxide hydrolase family protein [Sulfitobacter sp. 20_GPM-1509m]|uniref:epoxide hydrolase family protein n=1 Tax=Sulfitobacter sp. 20_GPM-1509m TaxID=1380367 RepID=UPI000687B46D|nr:epoxide hydrolase family protein [Sulfitobacter sp. 20_GPM-1509m]
MCLVEPLVAGANAAFQARLEILSEILAETRIPAGEIWQEDCISREVLTDLLEDWRDMDFPAFAKNLGDMPHFVARIDGQTQHFLHFQTTTPAPAVLMLHGWPSSFLEMHAIQQSLARLRSATCVIPSLPGFAFSRPLEVPPSVGTIACTLLILMTSLGHTKFFIHANDWGSVVAQEIARRAPERVMGLHASFLPTPPPENRVFTGEDGRRATMTREYVKDRAPYWRIQSQAPQTLGLALDTSPVGLLAWIADRFLSWRDPALPFDPVAILRTATLYWATRSAASSMHIYHANRKRMPSPAPQVPLGVAVMPRDLVLPIRSLAKERFNVLRWTEFEIGGHFPGFEVPDDIAADLDSFLKELEYV